MDKIDYSKLNKECPTCGEKFEIGQKVKIYKAGLQPDLEDCLEKDTMYHVGMCFIGKEQIVWDEEFLSKYNKSEVSDERD